MNNERKEMMQFGLGFHPDFDNAPKEIDKKETLLHLEASKSYLFNLILVLNKKSPVKVIIIDRDPRWQSHLYL